MNKPLSYSFPPLVSANCYILILGSMPGQVSLDQQQYYAHPRNAFWKIMAALTHTPADADYAKRCTQCIAANIAVWDVMKACYRPGSLDQHIDNSTVEANDFVSFLQNYPAIHTIFFNGAKAEQTFKQAVLPTFPQQQQLPTLLRLPSTSPAHAAMSLDEKTAIWLTAIEKARQAFQAG